MAGKIDLILLKKKFTLKERTLARQKFSPSAGQLLRDRTVMTKQFNPSLHFVYSKHINQTNEVQGLSEL